MLIVIKIFGLVSDLDIVESLKTFLEVKSDLERSLSNLVPPSERDRQEISRLRRVSKKSILRWWFKESVALRMLVQNSANSQSFPASTAGLQSWIEVIILGGE
jgi:hypothetical protein